MYGNPYYNPGQRYQPMPTQPIMNQPMTPQPYIQPVQQPTSQVGLLGKSVDNIDVVKAMDIPLDGSVSYFPLTDGSAIVSKQLQTDGTSKIVVYKPTQEDRKEAIQFATLEDIQEAINEIDLSDIQDLKDDVREIKKQLKEFKSKKSKDDE